MPGILRVAFAILLSGVVAIAPAQAGVPVPPVPYSELPAPADELADEPSDRSPRSVATRFTPTCGWPLRTTGSAPLAPHAGRPPAGPFYTSVAPHVRFCVWRE